MFAVKDLPARFIICLYRGLYGTSFSIDVEKNSIFSCGWIHDGENSSEILLDGQEIVGFGRYLNSSDSEETANCNARVCCSTTGIFVYLSTKKAVNKD